jgi:patatin-related protein
MVQVRPAGAQQPGVRELRLAVVCYGGVSLAVYMHGVTKEIQKLVVASVAFERDRETNPFDETDSAHAYWDVLARLASRDTGPDGERSDAPRTRVVVDIISGTSAGGINGIFLAKALASNRSQDALRDVWLDEGDITKLLRGPRWLPAGLRFVGYVARSLARPSKVEPPLRGDEMCRLLYGALADMDVADPALGDVTPDTLVPRQALDLYVPLTDFHGYGREIPLDDPRFVRDRTHRHVLNFHHDAEGVSQFAPRWNHALGFAARATSSIPGAFPPLSFDTYAEAFEVGSQRDGRSYDGDRPDLRALAGDLFPLYALTEGAAADRTYFIDGGMLDNFPFRSAIDAIATRPAGTEVDRRLLFIEPDPSDGAGASYGGPPTWHGTIYGGFFDIPTTEPVLDDFLSLAERNRSVARVRDVIETSFGTVSAAVTAMLTDHPDTLPTTAATGEELAEWQDGVALAARDQAGFAYGTYLRMRVRDVVDRYAAAIASVQQFPPGSYQASFVGNVLRAWARSDGLFAQSPTGTDGQRLFLTQHDLDYHERRIRFVIAAVNWWYRDVGTPGFPTRPQLDDAKKRLYARLRELRDIDRGAADDPSFVAVVRDVFDADEVRTTVLESARDEDDVVEHHLEALTGLRGALRERVDAALPAVVQGLHADLRAAMDEWSPEVAGALLTRYLGFPFWDVLTYPLAALSGVGERDHVEATRMSPVDVSLLAEEGEQKLYGVSLKHFGAFFSRSGREKDYLWGRLDAAERLVGLLLDDPDAPGLSPPDPAACRPVFEAVLADEAALAHAQDLLGTVRTRVDRLPPSPSPRT